MINHLELMHNSGDITNLAMAAFDQLMLPKPQIRNYVIHKLLVTKNKKIQLVEDKILA